MYNFLKDSCLTLPDNINGRKGDFLAAKDEVNGDYLIMTLTRDHAEIAAQAALKDSTAKWEDYMRVVTFPCMGKMFFCVFIKPLKTN